MLTLYVVGTILSCLLPTAEIVDGEMPPVLVDGDIYEPVHNESSRVSYNCKTVTLLGLAL